MLFDFSKSEIRPALEIPPSVDLEGFCPVEVASVTRDETLELYVGAVATPGKRLIAQLYFPRTAIVATAEGDVASQTFIGRLMELSAGPNRTLVYEVTGSHWIADLMSSEPGYAEWSKDVFDEPLRHFVIPSDLQWRHVIACAPVVTWLDPIEDRELVEWAFERNNRFEERSYV